MSERKILLNDIFGKDHFDNVIEYKLLLYIAAFCKQLGVVLDITRMTPWFDAEKLKATYSIKMCHDYMRDLIKQGALDVGADPEKVPEGKPLAIKFDQIIQENLFEEKNNTLYWCYDTPRNNDYSCRSEFTGVNAEDYIFALTAYYLLMKSLGYESSKYLLVDFNFGSSKYHSLVSSNIYLYIDIYACTKSIPMYAEYIKLSMDKVILEKKDLDFLLFMKNARYDGKLRDYTVKEKLEKLNLLNYDIGGIYVLWHRKKMNENNPAGIIDKATIIRLDEISDDFLGVLRIPVNSTYEERELDYYEISEDINYKYIDMLQRKPIATSVAKVSLYNLGIENFLNTEDNFITKLDTSEMTSTVLFFNSKLHRMELPAIEVIYWIMCQGNVDFDRQKYKDMYNHGNELLWDRFGSEQELVQSTFREEQIRVYGNAIVAGA